jgi:GNAT superfamily N-acetyltransferase
MRIVIPADRPKYEMTLPDGDVLTLSPILKTDKEFFRRGVDELSMESKFARFGQGVSTLSDRELDYLTDVDQRTHVAWGAAIDDEVAGVGRYIVPGEGGCVELALTVLDDMQRRGVGSALLIALAAVARADGHEELCFEAGAGNRAVLHIMGVLEVAPLLSGERFERRVRLSDLPRSPDDAGLVAVIDEIRA